MKVGLIGYGRMGRILEKLAPDLSMEVVTCIDSHSSDSDWNEIKNVDVCIDFSHPKAVVSNVQKASCFCKSIVIGTSGWYDEIEAVKELVDKHKLGIIYAQNFSLGMNLFIQIVAEAARLMNHMNDYDVALFEVHHRKKIDSPSGTACALSDAILQNVDRKTRVNSNCIDRAINNDELHVSSIRVGSVPGTHTVIFNSAQDTITLTHQAHDRSVWARGALEAAKWIQNRKGFFHINDMMEELTSNS